MAAYRFRLVSSKLNVQTYEGGVTSDIMLQKDLRPIVVDGDGCEKGTGSLVELEHRHTNYLRRED
jgi:hypothetical protein